MSLRVAMVGACPYPVPQGSQVLLKATACALRDRGNDVHLVVYGYGIGDDDSGLPVHRAPLVPGARKTSAGPSLAKPIQDMVLARTLRRVIDEAGIDVVHAHNYEGLLVALAVSSRPVVYHAHNAMGEELPHFLPGTGALGTWLDRTLPRRANHVIAPHPALADYLLSCGCDSNRISVIPPSVDTAQFACDEVTDDLPPVLFTGNLDAYQNLGLLRDAMDIVRRQEPDARLIVATADARPAPWAERVATPDLPALRGVLAADAVVACPRVSWSGYPMKLLNAMAAAKACIACRGAAHPLEHERTGLVTPDNDAPAFASALLSFLRDPGLRRRLGQAAREKVERDHAPSVIAGQIERVYLHHLGGGQ